MWRSMWAVRWAAMLEYIVVYWVCGDFWKGDGRLGRRLGKIVGLVHCAAEYHVRRCSAASHRVLCDGVTRGWFHGCENSP